MSVLDQNDEPSAVVLVQPVDAKPGRPRDLADGFGAEHRPGERVRVQACALEPDPVRLQRRAGWSKVGDHPAPGARSAATRRSSSTGSPPMPMLPSASRAHTQSPSPGSRSNTSRHSALTPRARVNETASGTMSIPRTPMPREARWQLILPAPQPTSSAGPPQKDSTTSSLASGRAIHRDIGNRCGWSWSPCTVHGAPARAAAKCGTANARSTSPLVASHVALMGSR